MMGVFFTNLFYTSIVTKLLYARLEQELDSLFM